MFIRSDGGVRFYRPSILVLIGGSRHVKVDAIEAQVVNWKSGLNVTGVVFIPYNFGMRCGADGISLARIAIVRQTCCGFKFFLSLKGREVDCFDLGSTPRGIP